MPKGLLIYVEQTKSDAMTQNRIPANPGSAKGIFMEEGYI
jgi:hypothetical protein